MRTGRDKCFGWLRAMADKYPTALADVECHAECGEGWSKLIEPCLALIEAEGGHVAQIKEKFGGLRLYVAGCSDETQAAIYRAQDDSFRVCEDCGAPGKRVGGGWIRTLCVPCTAVMEQR